MFTTVLYILCIQSILKTTSFNLSPKHSLVYTDPSHQDGSYFGYTVNLRRNTSGTSWLVVGAPRGNSTESSYLKITEPGVVYQCPIEENGNCSPMFLDSKGNYVDGKYSHLLDNAWIGGSADALNIPDDRIVVCGGRSYNTYQRKTSLYSLSGVCFVTNSGKPESVPKRLMPLANYDRKFYRSTEDDNYPDNTVSYFYAYGQAGLSTHIVKDKEEILIGAPGTLNWTGSVVKYAAEDLEKPVIPNPLKTRELNTYSYFGYSLSSGSFRKSIFYVAGAPRAGKQFQGKVYIFRIDNEKLDVKKVLEGEKSGEYYGSAVCVMDVNGDGQDDILVGAPRYADRNWDEGRLYVHLNKENLKFNKPVAFSSEEAGAQFGSAVSCLGDIDMDGFNDFAVGAPYEDSGRGVVYVYYGKENMRNVQKQRIPGKDIDLNVMGFGISISKAMDVDDNNYLDFAVGAYTSGHVAVIKSLPTITYESSLTSNVTTIGLDAKGFNLTVCIKYEGKYTPEATTMVNLTLDERCQFVDVERRDVSQNLELTQGKRRCLNYSVEIKKIRLDYTIPLNFKLEYGLKMREDETFCKTCPVVNTTNGLLKTKLTFATACSNNNQCRPDLVVTAEFINAESPLIIGTKSELKIEVTVKNNGESAFLAYLNMFIPDTCNLLRLPQPCEMTEKRELKCFLGNPLTKGSKNTIQFDVDMKGVPSGTEFLEFRMKGESSGSEETPENNKYILKLALVTKANISLIGNANQEKIVFWRQNGTEESLTPFYHVYEFRNLGPSPLLTVGLEFKIPVSVGTARNVVEIQNIEAQHNSRLLGCNRSDKRSFRRTISISSNETQVETTTTDVEVSSEPQVVDELEDSGSVVNSSESETPQSKSKLLNLGGYLEPTKDKVLVVDCKNKRTTCITVSCIINEPIAQHSKGVVNFTLLAKFKDLESALGDHDVIHFITNAEAKIESPRNIEMVQEDRSKQTEVTTIFYGRIRVERINPAYVLGIPVGIGIVILLILILIFWKLRENLEII